MGDMKWRQIKQFAIQGFGVLRPGATYKSEDLAETFGIEGDIEVLPAHVTAAKAEVASWKSKPEAHVVITERIAWWFAFGEALMVLGIGPHEGESKKKRTGMSPALDYLSRIRTRIHSERNPLGDIDSHARAKGFLKKAGLDSANYELPVPVPRERKGGNLFSGHAGFARRVIEEKVETQPVPQAGSVEWGDRVPDPALVLAEAMSDVNLATVAAAMSAAGISPLDIAQALAKLKLAS